MRGTHQLAGGGQWARSGSWNKWRGPRALAGRRPFMPRKAEPGRLMPARQVIGCERWAGQPLDRESTYRQTLNRCGLDRLVEAHGLPRTQAPRMGSALRISAVRLSQHRGAPGTAEASGAPENRRLGFSHPVTSAGPPGWLCPVHRIGIRSPRTNGRSDLFPLCLSRYWTLCALRE